MQHAAANRNSGFTLIELMIVTGIIGVLAAFAAPTYQGYIDMTNLTRVHTHFEDAVRFVEVSYTKHQTSLALGTGTDTPETTAEWLALLNASDGLSPGGTSAFEAGAGNIETGAVGITATGTLAGMDAQVVVTFPPFGDHLGDSATLSLAAGM